MEGRLEETVHFLFTDETNLTPDAHAKFFGYGGLIVPPNALGRLHDGVVAIRARAGYGPADEFKFQTAARPTQVSVAACAQAKNDVLELCIELGCRFIVYVVLHAIARNQQSSTIVEWGANQVIGKFNCYLHQNGGEGVVVVDRLPSAAEYRLLTDRFTRGLTFAEDPPVALDRIRLFSSSCSNASHASSAMDIVLGAFRYCINQPRNLPAARSMMARLVKLIWCEQRGEALYPMERGLVFRPKTVSRLDYKTQYDDLLAWINELLREDESPAGVGA